MDLDCRWLVRLPVVNCPHATLRRILIAHEAHDSRSCGTTRLPLLNGASHTRPGGALSRYRRAGRDPPTAVAALKRVTWSSASRLTSRSLEGHVCAHQHGPTGDLIRSRDNPRLA